MLCMFGKCLFLAFPMALINFIFSSIVLYIVEKGFIMETPLSLVTG